MNFSKIPPIFTYICTFGFGIRSKARCFSGFGFGLNWKTYFRSFTGILHFWFLINFQSTCVLGNPKNWCGNIQNFTLKVPVFFKRWNFSAQCFFQLKTQVIYMSSYYLEVLILIKMWQAVLCKYIGSNVAMNSRGCVEAMSPPTIIMLYTYLSIVVSGDF